MYMAANVSAATHLNFVGFTISDAPYDRAESSSRQRSIFNQVRCTKSNHKDAVNIEPTVMRMRQHTLLAMALQVPTLPTTSDVESLRCLLNFRSNRVRHVWQARINLMRGNARLKRHFK